MSFEVIEVPPFGLCGCGGPPGLGTARTRRRRGLRVRARIWRHRCLRGASSGKPLDCSDGSVGARNEQLQDYCHGPADACGQEPQDYSHGLGDDRYKQSQDLRGGLEGAGGEEPLDFSRGSGDFRGRQLENHSSDLDDDYGEDYGDTDAELTDSDRGDLPAVPAPDPSAVAFRAVMDYVGERAVERSTAEWVQLDVLREHLRQGGSEVEGSVILSACELMRDLGLLEVCGMCIRITVD